MEIKILFKNTSYLILTRIVKFVVGFIRAKLVAVLLGTLGAGMISQLDQLTLSLSQFTLLGMNDGLVKEIAEKDKETDEFKQTLPTILKSYILMISIVLIIVALIGIYFSKEFTKYFLGDVKYYAYFIIGLASFPILVSNSVPFAILKSFKQIKYIARSELIVIIINIIVFIPLIYFIGLTGAVIYVTFSLVFRLIINQYYARKIVLKKIGIRFKDIILSRISKSAIKELFVFAGFGLTAGIVSIFSDMFSRIIVVNQLGIKKIGIYSPVLTWASLFTGFILPSVGTYLYPRFCECKTDEEVIIVLNDSLRFVTLLMIPIILLSIPIRYQLIPLFYSKEFTIAGNFLPWHFLGILFFLWMYIFIQAMMPTGRIKTEGIITIVMALIDVSIVYFFVPRIGLYGFMLKFIISPVLIFLFYIFYWRNQIQFKLEMKNIILMVYALSSAILLIAIEKFVIQFYIINFIISIILLLGGFLILDKSEKNFIINKIKLIKSNLNL